MLSTFFIDWWRILNSFICLLIYLLCFCSVPFYLAVNVIYGAEVSRELTPLWVFGPLIMAVYITIFRKLCELYVFSFKRTIKVIKSAPSFCSLAFVYVFSGKLKQDIGALILLPIMFLTNDDYKELRRSKFEELRQWFVEKYLDFVEEIWPYYCRTIRFLKRANFI